MCANHVKSKRGTKVSQLYKHPPTINPRSAPVQWYTERVHTLMGSCICQEKDLQGEIYREGGFLRLLTHVHTVQPAVTPTPGAGEICQLKALGTVYHSGLGRMYGC